MMSDELFHAFNKFSGSFVAYFVRFVRARETKIRE